MIRPRSCGGSGESGLVTSIPIHDTRPRPIDSIAPCVFARFQYRPNTSGTNATTSVTLYAFSTML